jgi:hypothetical protein
MKGTMSSISVRPVLENFESVAAPLWNATASAPSVGVPSLEPHVNAYMARCGAASSSFRSCPL